MDPPTTTTPSNPSSNTGCDGNLVCSSSFSTLKDDSLNKNIPLTSKNRPLAPPLKSVKPHSGLLRVETNSKVNSVIPTVAVGTSKMTKPIQSDFYCDLCQVQSTNLSAHYDHLNSKRHQKAAGFTLKVQRSTLDQVLAKLEELKKEHARICSAEKDGNVHHKHVSYSERMEQENALRREERKKKKLSKAGPEPEPMPSDPEMLQAGFSFSAFGSLKSLR